MTPANLLSLAAPIGADHALAQAYVRCAADQLARGHYTHCAELLKYAGMVCADYTPLLARFASSETP